MADSSTTYKSTKLEAPEESERTFLECDGLPSLCYIDTSTCLFNKAVASRRTPKR